MGKRQPKITNKKHRKKNKNQNSSKSSRRLNNYSKGSKSRFNSFFSQNGRNSKRGSSKKWQRNINNYDNNFNSFNNIINITNNNNFSNNNFFIVDPIWNNIQNNNEKPEWMTEETEKIEDSNQRFSKEIMEYVTYVTPKNRSSSERETTVHRLRQIIEKKRPEWKVHLFGSYKQGTSTVFSDLDFEIIIDKNSSRKRDIDELFILMKILRKYCSLDREIREECGYKGIDKEECERRDCCWKIDSYESIVPWCFHGYKDSFEESKGGKVSINFGGDE